MAQIDDKIKFYGEKQMTSEEFKATREKLNMTQGHLARKIGLSERSIRYYEQGGRAVPAPVSILLETFLGGLQRGKL